MAAAASSSSGSGNVAKAKVPRSFKLLDEYDAAIGKGHKSYISGKHSGLIQYGLDEDITDEKTDLLSRWKGILIGIQGKQTGQFMYQFQMEVPANYPDSPPKMRFLEPQIGAMPCVDKNGNVDIKLIKPKFVWNSECDLAHLLMAIRDNMEDPNVLKASEKLGSTKY